MGQEVLKIDGRSTSTKSRILLKRDQMYSDALYDVMSQILRPGSDQMTKHKHDYCTFKTPHTSFGRNFGSADVASNGEVGSK